MKKSILKSFVLLALLIPSLNSQAATYSMGTFYAQPLNPDGNYSFDTTGIFWDEYDFSTRNYTNFYRGVDINISGTHLGMFNDELLLINLNTRQTYTLDEDFDFTFSSLRYNQRFAITGSGLSATDSSILSNYNISFEEVTVNSVVTPNPVPLPAAAWLFASGLLGFVTINKKRLKSSIS